MALIHRRAALTANGYGYCLAFTKVAKLIKQHGGEAIAQALASTKQMRSSQTCILAAAVCYDLDLVVPEAVGLIHIPFVLQVSTLRLSRLQSARRAA